MGKLNIMEFEDHQVSNKYDDTTTADWLTLKGPNHSVDWIWDVADPNASTNYDEAPIGSLYFWILAGSVTSFIKTTAVLWVEQT